MDAGQLSAEEQKLALEVAEAAIDRASLRTAGKLLLVDRSLELGKAEAGRSVRLAHVSHYRYDGDLAITTVVDLATRSVVAQYQVAHQPTRLAGEEIEQIRALVLANERVRSALGKELEKVELLPMVFGPAKDQALFGKRVALVQFKRGQRFLALPFAVVANLTDTTVLLEEPNPKSGHDHP